MVSNLQWLERSLIRKQNLEIFLLSSIMIKPQRAGNKFYEETPFEVSLLPSNGILPPSAGKKFDEETTFEVSLLPSNGILPPSAGKKFDEETNLWKFSLYLRYCPNTTEASFEI